MKNRNKTILALAVGAAVGAGIGLLYAPTTGKETRRKLGRGAKEAKDKISEASGVVATNASDVLKKIEKQVDKTLSSVSFRADDVLNSMERKLEELRKQNKKFQGSENEFNDTDSAIASNGSEKKKTSVVSDTPNPPTVKPTDDIVS